jgi:hypothetical protein
MEDGIGRSGVKKAAAVNIMGAVSPALPRRYNTGSIPVMRRK